MINFTHVNIDELNFTHVGENVRIFRSADENFLFTGSDLLHLRRSESAKSQGGYSLQATHDFRIDEGAVFFKVILNSLKSNIRRKKE